MSDAVSIVVAEALSHDRRFTRESPAAEGHEVRAADISAFEEAVGVGLPVELVYLLVNYPRFGLRGLRWVNDYRSDNKKWGAGGDLFASRDLMFHLGLRRPMILGGVDSPEIVAWVGSLVPVYMMGSDSYCLDYQFDAENPIVIGVFPGNRWTSRLSDSRIQYVADSFLDFLKLETVPDDETGYLPTDPPTDREVKWNEWRAATLLASFPDKTDQMLR